MPLTAFWLVTALAAVASPQGKSVTAEKWINRLTLRFEDQSQHVVLFFDTKRARGLREIVERLNKLSRRRDVLVIGVTPEREKRVREFIREYRVRFPVGVQSLSYKAFGVKEFPQAIYIKNGDSSVIVDWNEFESELGDPPAPGGILPDELSVGELKKLIDSENRLDLLETLRVRLDPEEFVRYCDEIEAQKSKGDPWWSGKLQYQRHLANESVPVKQPASTAAMDAWREAKRLGLRKTAELHELYESRPSWSSDDVLDVYSQHLGNEPEQLVYRSDWVLELGRTGDPQFVSPLLDMLDVESDAGIRFRIANSIGGIHTTSPVTDREGTIRRLQEDLDVEENIRWVRPALQLTIDLLRRYPEEIKD